MRQSIQQLLSQLERGRPVVLTPEDLPGLLEASTVLREDDTGFAGPLRILELGGRTLVQEQHPDSEEVIVRELDSRQAADRFMDKRLADYERMWDGCGCKINYLGPA
jgi:hypothetical protein